MSRKVSDAFQSIGRNFQEKRAPVEQAITLEQRITRIVDRRIRLALKRAGVNEEGKFNETPRDTSRS